MIFCKAKKMALYLIIKLYSLQIFKSNQQFCEIYFFFSQFFVCCFDLILQKALNFKLNILYNFCKWQKCSGWKGILYLYFRRGTFHRSYNRYKEIQETSKQKIMQYHVKTIKSSIIFDNHGNNWADEKPFSEVFFYVTLI